MTLFALTTPHRLRFRGVLLCSVGAVLVLWAVASSYYIVFHDSVLANLLSRQAEMQYAYEDRIAALRDAVEDAKARTQRDGRAQEGAFHDLAALGARLEARADALAAIVGTGRASDMRLRADADAGCHAALVPGNVAASFAALDTRQKEAISTLRERTEQANARTRAALAELGLAPAPPAAVGGPYVPIVEGTQSPEQDLALLEDGLARRRQLETVAGRLPLRQPVEGPLDVTSSYGARRDPFYGRLALHTGIDLRGAYGSTVRAVAAGVVTIAGPEAGYGTLVEIDHGNGYATRYAHLSSLSVEVGQKIDAGAGIGQIGTSGRSTGPHLHYEVRIAGEPVDPARYLKLAAAIAE